MLPPMPDSTPPMTCERTIMEPTFMPEYKEKDLLIPIMRME